VHKCTSETLGELKTYVVNNVHIYRIKLVLFQFHLFHIPKKGINVEYLIIEIVLKWNNIINNKNNDI
jgi:hypothetical protein